MPFQFSDEGRNITVYDFNAATGEYIETWPDIYIYPNTGLPAHCTHIAPPAVEPGFAAVFDQLSESWSLVEDHRGEMAYQIETKKERTISDLGAIPARYTLTQPDSLFCLWDGEKWVRDEEKAKQADVDEAVKQKESLMVDANHQISILQDAVDLGIATEEEGTQLHSLKKYRVLLNRIDTDLAPHIEWPTSE